MATTTTKKPAARKTSKARRTAKRTAEQGRKKTASIGHPGIGAYVKGLLISGKSTDEILRAVARHFPGAQTSRASVSWYRSRLNKEMEEK